MSYFGSKEFYSEVAKGNVVGHSLVHKFGKNEAVGSSYEPLALGGIYQTPQVGSATTLRVKAGDANDTAAGSGAREVTLQGLDETGALVTEALATNGASSGTAGSVTWIRLFRAYVSESGTYANTTTGSHADDVVIETTGGVAWLTIDTDSQDFERGQSQVGSYSVPLGKTAYVHEYVLTTDSSKAVDFIFLQRQGILETSAPYQAMRTVIEEVGIQGHFPGSFLGGQSFPELTDVGFMVKAASAAVVTADFEILLVDN